MKEHNKLTATFLNNIASAFVIFGMLKPILEGTTNTVESVIFTFCAAGGGVAIHMLAREYLRGKEEDGR